ncbi:HD-GYP domain-containing protein [Pseudomonas kurunegalensis]|uniref:HD-GYP domain-containing protein n=1 Tax=Pseudomonas kurunegalensis TaxID=485880 RepID=UPI002119548A|nr:HD-GYP domain-containing protein [Pseudomonas kurunegalensis]
MIKIISVYELCLGMYVHDFCVSGMDSSFWKGRFLIQTPYDLKRIKDSAVRVVWIDVDKGIDVASGRLEAPPLSTAGGTAPPDLTTLAAELPQAQKLCAEAKMAVVAMFSEAYLGQALNLARVGELVSQISDSVLRHPSALISLARLKTANDYTHMHSVAVSGLMIALAHELKLSQALVVEAGIAGMLHDIGKIAIPEAILDKPGKLTDEEFDVIRKHPKAAINILIDNEHVSDLVLDVCLHHHEKYDGSGYPHRLANEQISLFSRMGAVCDVYDALTSTRPYKAGWDPAEAIHQMAKWQGHFDNEIFHAFIRTIGIYPVGALVRLESGLLGVVIEQHEKSLLTPQVKVFFSTRLNLPVPHAIIDLAKWVGREKIISRENPAKWGFSQLDVLWTGPPTSAGLTFSA